MPLVMALDQGTTSSRAILFDDSGRPAATAQREFTQHYPKPGWVEHDAEEIWQTQIGVAEEALDRAGVTSRDLAAVGIANQRETVVLWDRATGKPLHNAVVWQDRRTADVCDAMRARGLEPEIQSWTGLVLDPYFSATKIAWLLDNVPGARDAASAGKLAVGTIDSWLAYKLTGGACHVTDASNASRTLLLDIHRGVWDDRLLAHFNVPREVLPEVVSTSGAVGEIEAKLPLAGVPLASLVGDQQAALFGQACFAPGAAKNTYGTGCFLLMNTGALATESTQKLLSTVAWRIGDQLEYALEGSVFIGGAAVGWLRDGLGIIKSSGEVERLARSVADSGGVTFVPAFAGLGAPHWDAYARGAIVGLTRGTTAAHLARAALDGVALQVADLLEAIEQDSGVDLTELRVDGGASMNDLLLQTQADLLQTPVVRPQITETTALGAAYLAGLAVGVWRDRSAVDDQWRADRRFEPEITADEAASRRATWRRAVERAKGWAIEE